MHPKNSHHVISVGFSGFSFEPLTVCPTRALGLLGQSVSPLLIMVRITDCSQQILYHGLITTSKPPRLPSETLYSMKCILIETYKYQSLNVRLTSSKLIFISLLWVHVFLMHSYHRVKILEWKVKSIILPRRSWAQRKCRYPVSNSEDYLFPHWLI